MIILARPANLLIKEFCQFRKNYARYRVQNGHLFRRNSKNIFSRRVMDNLEDKRKIMKQLHNENDHKGKKNTYQRTTDRY